MLKKDSLVKGTLILAAAALIARFLGLFQKVPLDYILEEEGAIAFGLANQIYLVLLIIATAGFPSAISKMVSERYALGRPDEAKRIYHAALIFGAVTGLILATALFIFAPFHAEHIAKMPSATLSIRAIAPALLLFPIIAMMRGYFQGRQLMSAGGISQIVEQFMRVFLGIGLGLIVLGLGWGDDWGAAAVTFGSVFGSIGAFSVMLWFGRKLKKQDQSGHVRQYQLSAEGAAALRSSTTYVSTNHTVPRRRRSAAPLRFKTIYREILSMSLPALLTSMAVNLVYLFDTSLFVRLTEAYYSAETSSIAFKDYSIKAISLAGIPPILAIALATSIIPVIASAYSLKKMNEVSQQASLVMRIVCFTGVPIALLLSVAAYSVTGLLFASPSGSGAVAALTAGTILQITMMTTNSILYGMGKQRLSMAHTIVGLVVKFIFSIALGSFLGVYGLIIGSTLCFLIITILNFRSINKVVKLSVLGKRWVPYIIAVAVAALAGLGVERGILALTDSWTVAKLSYFAAAAVTAGAVGLIYLALVIVLRVITPNDVSSFPRQLRKPFKLLMKPFYRNSL